MLTTPVVHCPRTLNLPDPEPANLRPWTLDLRPAPPSSRRREARRNRRSRPRGGGVCNQTPIRLSALLLRFLLLEKCSLTPAGGANLSPVLTPPALPLGADGGRALCLRHSYRDRAAGARLGRASCPARRSSCQGPPGGHDARKPRTVPCSGAITNSRMATTACGHSGSWGRSLRLRYAVQRFRAAVSLAKASVRPSGIPCGMSVPRA